VSQPLTLFAFSLNGRKWKLLRKLFKRVFLLFRDEGTYFSLKQEQQIFKICYRPKGQTLARKQQKKRTIL